MNINYDGKVYEFDLDEIDVSQATMIKRKYNFTLLSLEAGLRDGDPDALRCIYWLMLRQNGENHNLDNVNFKVVKFANALQTANIAEAEKAVLENADNLKEQAE